MCMFQTFYQEQNWAALLLSKVAGAQQFVWESGKNFRSIRSPSGRALRLGLHGWGILNC